MYDLRNRRETVAKTVATSKSIPLNTLAMYNTRKRSKTVATSNQDIPKV